MAVIVRNTSIFYSGTPSPALTLGAGDTLYVLAGVTLAHNTAEGAGVFVLGSGNIYLDGTLFGNVGLRMIGAANTTSEIVVGRTGQMIGTGTGFTLETAGTVNFVNYGMVQGITGAGMYLYGANRVGGTVTNFGDIRGEDFGIRVETGSGGFVLNNFGTVTATSGAAGSTAFVDNAVNSVTQVNNAGTMVGDVLLQSGADIYRGEDGRVLGTVRGGTGDDLLVGGSFRDVLYGDENNDRLDGGAGDDDLRGGSGDDIMDGRDGFDDLFRRRRQ